MKLKQLNNKYVSAINWQCTDWLAEKCIDMYVKQRVQNAEATSGDCKMIDKNLEEVVDQMFKRCFEDRQFKQVLITNLSDIDCPLIASRLNAVVFVAFIKNWFYLITGCWDCFGEQENGCVRKGHPRISELTLT